jgi:hypothetical protein
MKEESDENGQSKNVAHTSTRERVGASTAEIGRTFFLLFLAIADHFWTAEIQENKGRLYHFFFVVLP